MELTLTLKGPLFDRALVRRTVEAELRAAGELAAGEVRTGANAAVHRDLGTYEGGWEPVRHRFGVGAIASAVLENRAPNAAVMETGRGAGKTPPPVSAIEAWARRRGITPDEGDTASAWEGLARAIAVRLGLLGWPNKGSRGYLGPPAPVETALDRGGARVDSFFDQAVARIARRLS